MADFDRLGDLLPEGRPGNGPAAGDPGRRLAAVWADAVGAEVAANARPVQFRDGRLVVTTSSSAWAQTLQLMSPILVARLNERIGEAIVTRAVFRHAGWDPAWAAPDTQTPEMPPAAASAAAAPSPSRAVSGGPPDAASALGTATGTTPVGGAAPATGSAMDGFTAEERRALAEVDALPLPPATKDSIRAAMKAGFARARQDSGRS